MMGFLILQTEDVHLIVEGMDTPDDDPLVLRSYCRHCRAVLHTREMAATETTRQTSPRLAAEDAERALAHRVLCPGRG